MRALLINHSCGVGSTGRICIDIAKDIIDNGDSCIIAYGRTGLIQEGLDGIKIGNKMNIYSQVLCTRLFDRHGFGSKTATKKFLAFAEEYNPDLLWLHNIHGYYINFEMLFDWIKSRPNMRVKWTLHDCWAFTGHCSYFTMANCNKWKTNCNNCPQKTEYPASLLFDNSKKNYIRKKKAFTGVKDMTLITPSQWLADLVKQSFLQEYNVEVKYNTIDTDVFKPTESDFREKYNLQNKKIVLGVANVWHKRKGLNDFLMLSSMLSDEYAIVLVGLTKKQIEKLLPCAKKQSEQLLQESTIDTNEYIEVVKTHGGVAINSSAYAAYKAITGQNFSKKEKTAQLILLQKTNSAKELAQIYSAADIFLNPTYEDNYPTTNLEAQACGTFVVTYDTGGSKETLK